jgi:hypothetical protein
MTYELAEEAIALSIERWFALRLAEKRCCGAGRWSSRDRGGRCRADTSGVGRPPSHRGGDALTALGGLAERCKAAAYEPMSG